MEANKVGRYYSFIGAAFQRKQLVAPTQQCWEQRDDCSWFISKENYSGPTPWGSQLNLIKGELYHSYQSVAPELLRLVEIIPSPYLTATQKLAPIFETLPATLLTREIEMINAGCEAQIHGRTQGSLTSWADGTQKLLDVIDLIKERVARENSSQNKPQASFPSRVFA